MGFVWGPALAVDRGALVGFITSGEVGKQTGKPTFDGLAVARKWGEANADFMAKFVKVAAASDAAYRDNPKAWTPDFAPVLRANVQLIGGDPKDVAATVAGYSYVPLAELVSPAWLVMARTAARPRRLRPRPNFLNPKARSIPSLAIMVSSSRRDMPRPQCASNRKTIKKSWAGRCPL